MIGLSIIWAASLLAIVYLIANGHPFWAVAILLFAPLWTTDKKDGPHENR